MSTDSISYGVKTEQQVTQWFRVQADDRPSGYIEVSKTPPTGANAMTVTIKPMYGEAFTVNADLLREAMWLALDQPPRKFDEAYYNEGRRLESAKRAKEGDVIEFADQGRVNYRRLGTIEATDEYAVVVRVHQQPVEVEEGVPVLHRKVRRHDILRAFEEGSA